MELKSSVRTSQKYLPRNICLLTEKADISGRELSWNGEWVAAVAGVRSVRLVEKYRGLMTVPHWCFPVPDVWSVALINFATPQRTITTPGQTALTFPL